MSLHGKVAVVTGGNTGIGKAVVLALAKEGADIVIAGLPNESEPLCDDLIDAIQPRVIVIADSEFPATRRASRTLHERLEQKKIPVIYTRTAGAVKIVTEKSGWKLETMDGQKYTASQQGSD